MSSKQLLTSRKLPLSIDKVSYMRNGKNINSVTRSLFDRHLLIAILDLNMCVMYKEGGGEPLGNLTKGWLITICNLKALLLCTIDHLYQTQTRNLLIFSSYISTLKV